MPVSHSFHNKIKGFKLNNTKKTAKNQIHSKNTRIVNILTISQFSQLSQYFTK